MLASGNSGALTQAEAQLRSLSSLQQRIGRSDIAGLVALRADVAATVSAAQAAAQQPATAASSSQAQEAVLYQADHAARQTTAEFMRDYYDKHIFDKYLKFTSREDEEEYRHREQERKREIKEARSQHTPQGDLRANQLAIEQIKDAGAHGANRSPEYQPMLEKLEITRSNLSAQISASQKVPSEKYSAERQSLAPVEPSKIPADVLASLQAAQVTSADQVQDGHGVTVRNTPSSGRTL